jgi:molecular chaperone HtpG
MAEGGTPTIRIVSEKSAGALSVIDNGIGMDRQELIDNLGIIARSGTKAFLAKMQEAGRRPNGVDLIGQFGVGFYSTFMVADRIVVTSRRAGTTEAWVWESSGGGDFEVTPADEATTKRMTRGTEIVLHLKEDAKRYLDAYKIESIVAAYSNNIQFPIELKLEDGEPRQINSASALWQRRKSELKPEDYAQFYRAVTGGFDEPAMTLHYRAEGRYSYAALLFAPSVKPFDLFDSERKGRVKLYVRRVFITDQAELLPRYLRFIRGVVDSEDLPLNLSREILQKNLQLAQIRTAITSRVIAELETTAEKRPDAFNNVWGAFGQVLKEGIWEDPERREKLLRLARFTTTAGEGRTLKQYVEALKPNQREIYYLVGESPERLRANPKLEAATACGVEVLLLSDPVDALWTAAAPDFEGKSLRSLGRDDLDFDFVPPTEGGEAEKVLTEGALEATVIATLKKNLADHVADVRTSKRLTTSAACLVARGLGPDGEFGRLPGGQRQGAAPKPVLEVNLRHPLVVRIGDLFASDRDMSELSLLLFEQAQILEGELPAEPAAFTSRLNRFVLRGLERN